MSRQHLGREEDEEFDEILRVTRHPGWWFWLNLLDRILGLEDET